jgi:hypothetical protein
MLISKTTFLQFQMCPKDSGQNGRRLNDAIIAHTGQGFQAHVAVADHPHDFFLGLEGEQWSNRPNAMITRKAAPALAAGCTIVIKPVEATPLSALALGILAERAGIPAGVINIITGDASVIGEAFTASPIVRKLTFKGSACWQNIDAAMCGHHQTPWSRARRKRTVHRV